VPARVEREATVKIWIGTQDQWQASFNIMEQFDAIVMPRVAGGFSTWMDGQGIMADCIPAVLSGTLITWSEKAE